MPFALIGVFWFLYLTGNTLNILSGAGILLLAGIVVNNAIVLVDRINSLRRSGVGERESLLKAGEQRLRPIVMTALTTTVGLLPMAFGANDKGRLIYSPLAISVLGGLISSTILIPMVTPIIYSLTDDISKKLRTWWAILRTAG